MLGLSHIFRTGTSLLLTVCLWALCGCTTFPMRSQQVWRSAVDYRYPSGLTGSDEFETNLDTFTGSVAHPGNAAVLLQNGDQAYPVMLEMIARATTRISFETYIVESDATTDTFFAALRDAAARGVEVRVLVDAAGFGRGLVAHLDELSRHGIQARIFNPFFSSWTIIRANNRDHRKILVVDGLHAVVGGINISDKQAGDGVSGWRDTAVFVSGPAATEAECVFAETWEQGGRGIVGKNLPLTVVNPFKRMLDRPLLAFRTRAFVVPPFLPDGPAEQPADIDGFPFPADSHAAADAMVRVVSSSPEHRNSPTYDLAILGITAAWERVDIACAYFVPPLGLRRALIRAAERGVRVRLLLPGVTDVRWVREIGMRFYGELLEAGIEIYEWPYPILHAKTMAVDGRWLMVGSANMDSRSYFLNYEACMAITGSGLAEQAHRQFDIDLREAKPLTLEEWRRRGAKQRWLETVLTPLGGQF